MSSGINKVCWFWIRDSSHVHTTSQVILWSCVQKHATLHHPRPKTIHVCWTWMVTMNINVGPALCKDHRCLRLFDCSDKNPHSPSCVQQISISFHKKSEKHQHIWQFPVFPLRSVTSLHTLASSAVCLTVWRKRCWFWQHTRFSLFFASFPGAQPIFLFQSCEYKDIKSYLWSDFVTGHSASQAKLFLDAITCIRLLFDTSMFPLRYKHPCVVKKKIIYNISG